MDKLGKILFEILLSASTTSQYRNGRRGTHIYHVVNPNTTSWSTLVPAILNLYPQNVSVRAAQFDEWIEVLSQSEDDDFADPERNPAIKILDFYRGAMRVAKGPRVLTSHEAEKASKTLQRVGAVNEEWVRVWMRQWGFKMGQQKYFE